jgi:uncharacterized membrane protein YkvA (DUF1232 family)
MLERLRIWARQIKSQLLVLWFARAHPDMPLSAKLVTVAVVAYAFSPIDLIPDFIPVLGYLDDVIIVPAGIYLALRLVPEHVLADARRQADEWMAAEREKPRSYLAAAIFVVIWLAAACWITIRALEWFRAS